MSALRMLTARELARDQAVRRPRLVVGVDLGKRQDWSALSVVECATEARPIPDAAPHVTRPVSVYLARQLDRIKETSYEVVVDAVVGLLGRAELAGAVLVIDETGVGAAVGDMMERRRLRPKRITITGGQQPHRDGDRYTVPKKDLVTLMEVLLESRRLKVAEALPLAATFVAEAQNFQVTTTPSGHQVYGAAPAESWRDGSHDDMLLSVAIACWYAEAQPIGRGIRAIPWL